MSTFRPGDFITLFADASFCPMTHAWGYGWWCKFGDPATTRRGHGGGLFTESSLTAEVAAVRAGLEWISDELSPDDLRGKRLVVQTDCTGAIEIIKADLGAFVHKHKLAAAYPKHVRGHRGHSTPRNSVNTTCDRMAYQVMRQFREQKQRRA